MDMEYKKPLPLPTNETLTQPCWEAAKRHELMVQRCKNCDQHFFYPRETCVQCLHGLEDLEWTRVSGMGRVYSFTIVHQPADQAFVDDVPYVFAIIQLDEGPRMPGNVVGLSDPHDCHINMRVNVLFDDVTPTTTLAKWEPI